MNIVRVKTTTIDTHSTMHRIYNIFISILLNQHYRLLATNSLCYDCATITTNNKIVLNVNTILLKCYVRCDRFEYQEVLFAPSFMFSRSTFLGTCMTLTKTTTKPKLPCALALYTIYFVCTWAFERWYFVPQSIWSSFYRNSVTDSLTYSLTHSFIN